MQNQPTIPIPVRGMMRCPACDGEGRMHYSEGYTGEFYGVKTYEKNQSELCYFCIGEGHIRSPQENKSPCGECEGKGYYEPRLHEPDTAGGRYITCLGCNGTGAED